MTFWRNDRYINILFICGGAFSGLDKIIQQRSDKSGIGFGAEVKSPDDDRLFGEVIQDVEAEDLTRYGLIPEFVGRLPVVATLEELDEEALVEHIRQQLNIKTKSMVKTDYYSACKQANLHSLTRKFGLKPDKLGENLYENYQKCNRNTPLH